MNLKLISLGAAVLAAYPLLAREKTDLIVTKNGDHITCEIKELRSNTLFIKVDYILGTLSVDWSKVDHLESGQLFIVKAQDGTVYTGALSIPKTSGGRPQQIEILEAPEKEIALDRAQVVDVNQTASNFWQRLDGQIGVGFTYSKGNDSARYNLNSSVDYPAERWSAGASLSSNLTSNTGRSPSTRNQVTFSAQRLLRWNNWYYTGIADILQSSVQGIQIQNTLGGGIGRYIKNTGRTTLAVCGGFAWERVNYQEAILPSPTQQVTAALIGTSLNLLDSTRLHSQSARLCRHRR